MQLGHGYVYECSDRGIGFLHQQLDALLPVSSFWFFAISKKINPMYRQLVKLPLIKLITDKHERYEDKHRSGIHRSTYSDIGGPAW